MIPKAIVLTATKVNQVRLVLLLAVIALEESMQHLLEQPIVLSVPQENTVTSVPHPALPVLPGRC